MWSIFSRDPSKDFAYEIGDPIHVNEQTSFWIQHKGKKKANGENVTIFRYEIKPNEESYMDLAKSSLKRLKTLRHPSILTFIDSLETDKYVLVVTEYVEPLFSYIEQNLNQLTASQKEFAISWGILTVSKGLCFLNNDCNLIHCNLSIGSIYVNSGGDWKISNFEYLTNVDGSFPYKTYYKHKLYTPPEFSTDSSRKLHKTVDSWGLGCIIWELFNGKCLNDYDQLKSIGKISKKISQSYGTLISTNQRQRSSIQDFINKAQQNGGYFKNVFIESMIFLDEIQIKDSVEKNRFFSNLNNRIDSFPNEVCKNKILPLIITSLDYGDVSSHVLDLLFKIGKVLNETEYQKRMVPCIIKLFSAKDRSIRSKLLKEMETYAELIPVNLINEQVFPNLAQGFLDSNPIIREQTVKSIFYLAPKLNSQNLNDEVMKHFSRIQFKDPEGGIRTNTIVCLGKIAGLLQPHTRQNIMLPAFMRSLRDPFPPSRIAGILSLSATQNFFTLQDCTTKIMPVLCTILMDPEKQVRDHSFTTLKSFIVKMEKFSEDPSLIEQMESEINQSGSNVSSKLTSGLSWAVSSIAAKLTRSKIDEDGESGSNQNKIGNLPSKPINENNVSNKSNQSLTKNKPEPSSKSFVGEDCDNNTNDLDLNSGATDGWDEDNWDNEISNLGFSQNGATKSSSVQFKPAESNDPISSAWDDEDPLNDWDSNEWKTPESKVEPIVEDDPFKDMVETRTTQVNRVNARRTIQTSKPALNANKKGPMRLGAQKISKTS
ncbi:hypothetical protein RDWZM_009027 [Blomia tropicalis]|uniref:N-terminal kinase-like protein n=1 Tax=Blomia tropicalis TaxID=40697 RepID=A0A9Q0RKY1_BLOTA|nr:N-terminal kinase-like protein [Blomia tropicalis]KAJ6217870.1 hypothetical protein RDWZM_009027 [Blomia tropicalis]